MEHELSVMTLFLFLLISAAQVLPNMPANIHYCCEDDFVWFSYFVSMMRG